MPQTEKQQIGRYEILQEIGRGAMGVVFKGRDPLIGRAVAVKTITSGVAEGADLVERFYRDVKPANIVVTRDGMVKVVDFGIARLGHTSNTQTGMLLGTLAYMSPEQVRGQPADARCDIWAMGVVLYELITYQRPFTGENHAALLLSILQNEAPPIRQVVPECPVALERVIAKSLRKDEKERYASMDALLIDLGNGHS